MIARILQKKNPLKVSQELSYIYFRSRKIIVDIITVERKINFFGTKVLKKLHTRNFEKKCNPQISVYLMIEVLFFEQSAFLHSSRTSWSV